jgi:hypothetical protein
MRSIRPRVCRVPTNAAALGRVKVISSLPRSGSKPAATPALTPRPSPKRTLAPSQKALWWSKSE